TFNGFGVEPAGTTQQQNGSLLTWNLPPLPVGTYGLFYSVKVNNFVQAGTLLENQVWANNAGSAPVTAKADVTVIGDYTIKIGVYNEAGELVKIIKIMHLSQPV